MSQQGLRQASFRAIHGETGGTLNEDMLKAFAAEATIPAGATFNEAFMLWLQERLGSSTQSLSALMGEFAADQGVRNWASVGSFDPGSLDLLEETLALLAEMSVEPDNDRKVLINSTISALIDAGVWAKLDALWVFAAHISQAALLNWKAPGTFGASVGGGAPTFLTDRHYATDGSDDWINTGFNPSTAGGSFTQNSASFGVWNRLAGVQSGSIAGWFDGSDGVTIQPLNATTDFLGRINQASNSTLDADNATAVGLFALNRSGATALQGYRNGVAGTPGTNASTALNSANLRLGSITAASFTAAQFAVAFVGGSLSAQEHSDLYDALAAYMTAVGAA